MWKFLSLIKNSHQVFKISMNYLMFFLVFFFFSWKPVWPDIFYHKKWIQQTGFKPWTKLFMFHLPWYLWKKARFLLFVQFSFKKASNQREENREQEASHSSSFK